MIKIGTSGFSYPDWVGTVYPEGLPEREHLAFYAAEFPTVEINMTYYRVPTAAHDAGLGEPDASRLPLLRQGFPGLDP